MILKFEFFSLVALAVFFVTFVNGENWLVEVGANGKNTYTPNNFDANVGDNIVFHFISGVHDVNQADAFAKCVKSASPNAFKTSVNYGNTEDPPQATWNLGKVGPAYYFCSVSEHCSVGKMYAKVNILDKGTPLVNPGVKAPVSKPSQTSSTSPSPTSTSTPSPTGTSAASANKQISVAVIGGTLFSLVGYFF